MFWMWSLAILLVGIYAAIKFLGNQSRDQPNKKQPPTEERYFQVKKGKIPPGLDRASPVQTNDFYKVSEILQDLHNKHGSVVSIWHHDKYAVSIASPELFKLARNWDSRDLSLSAAFKEIIGDDSVAYVEKEETIRRRKIYDQHFMFKAVKHFFQPFQEVAEECVQEWKQLGPDDHVELIKTNLKTSMKSFLRTCIGSYFKHEGNFQDFQKKIDYVCYHAYGKKERSNEEEETRLRYIREIRETIKQIANTRRKTRTEDDNELFLDVLLQEEHFTEEQLVCDVLGFLLGAYHDFGTVISYMMYEMAQNEVIQNNVFLEIQSVLEDDGHVNADNYKHLTYLKQVMDEVLRLDYHAPYLGRIIEEDVELDGYNIPKGTSVYFALEALFLSPKYFKDPLKFDPDHFAPEQSKGRSPYVFKPFGLGGAHYCAGMTFAYCQAATVISEFVRNFSFQLVPGQIIKRQIAHEIWVKVSPRK